MLSSQRFFDEAEPKAVPAEREGKPLLILGCGHSGKCKKDHRPETALTIDSLSSQEPDIVGCIYSPNTLAQLKDKQFQSIVLESLPYMSHKVEYHQLIRNYQHLLADGGMFIICGNFVDEFFQHQASYRLFLNGASPVAILTKLSVAEFYSQLSNEGSVVSQYIKSLCQAKKIDSNRFTPIESTSAVRQTIASYSTAFRFSVFPNRRLLVDLIRFWSIPSRLSLFEALVTYQAEARSSGDCLAQAMTQLNKEVEQTREQCSPRLISCIDELVRLLQRDASDLSVLYQQFLSLTEGTRKQTNELTKQFPSVPLVLAALIHGDRCLKPLPFPSAPAELSREAYVSLTLLASSQAAQLDSDYTASSFSP